MIILSRSEKNNAEFFSCLFLPKLLDVTKFIVNRAVASGGAGGALASQFFGRKVNPISTRGADYAHHSTTSPPRFSDLATALIGIQLCAY